MHWWPLEIADDILSSPKAGSRQDDPWRGSQEDGVAAAPDSEPRPGRRMQKEASFALVLALTSVLLCSVFSSVSPLCSLLGPGLAG